MMNPLQSSVADVENAPGYASVIPRTVGRRPDAKQKWIEEESELTRALALTYGALSVLFMISAAITYFWLPAVTPLYCAASILSLLGIAGRFWGVRRRRDLQEKLSQLQELSQAYLGVDQFKVVWGARDTILKTGRVPVSQAIVTVMKTDLRGFSQICERIQGAALIDWLSRYIVAMEEVIMEHEGIIKSIEGDALHAVFGLEKGKGGPGFDHRTAALHCALALRARLSRLNAELQGENQSLTATRIGINTGEVTFGIIGGKVYMQYDVLGDTVNTAARLETYDKESMPTGEVCRIQAGASTLDPVKDRFSYDSIGEVELQGKSERVEIYRINSTGEVAFAAG